MNKNTNRNGHYSDPYMVIDPIDFAIAEAERRRYVDEPLSPLVASLPADPFRVEGVDNTLPF